MGCTDTVLFHENQTPRSDSINIAPLEPIFCPQILEPRLYRNNQLRHPADGGFGAPCSRSLEGCLGLSYYTPNVNIARDPRWVAMGGGVGSQRPATWARIRGK